ncbi:MAG: DUF551 domain-containing protein [Citrobacter freundii]|jgi:hypothetical protein|nr:DUF551 domain-containing protein [Citrobacter freundii]MCI1828458.1 DUF551 domain-containing protein [Citrobacter freundii]
MTTNNHPAHGPVSLERLRQIREILSKASVQSDGGNLGYAMDDAVKVIDGVIATTNIEPVACIDRANLDYLADGCDGHVWATSYAEPGDVLLYTTPITPISPDKMTVEMAYPRVQTNWHDAKNFAEGWNACLAAMLQSFGNSEQLDEVGSWNNHMNTPTAQAGNSPVTPDAWIPVSERMPLTPYENCLYEDVEVQVFAGDDVFIAHYAIGALPEPCGAWVDTSADITHWMPLAEPPRNK